MSETPTLVLTCPDYATTALRWICEDFVGRELNVGFDVRPDEARDNIEIAFAGKAITMTSVFFRENPFGDSQTPLFPLPELETFSPPSRGDMGILPALPILFGDDRYTESADGLHLGVDVLGGAFFLASRYEECFASRKDRHDRFPASESTAHRHGFLYRPLADEYVRLLCDLIQRVWPAIERRQHTAQVVVSCDVDIPFDPRFATATNVARMVVGDLVVTRRWPRLGKDCRNYLRHLSGRYDDPYDTFDWYMSTCERHNRQVEFFFIAGRPAGRLDGYYSLDDPPVEELLQRIARRGHRIGLHGSYLSYNSPDLPQRERQALLNACRRLGIESAVEGNRQHYLRWDACCTPDHLESAGFRYDCSGSFADQPGFRYGTCHPFRMWSWIRREPLDLIQRPLILMESSVLATRFLGLGYTERALSLMLQLKRTCAEFLGEFTVLWHNSHLMTPKDREFFEALIA